MAKITLYRFTATGDTPPGTDKIDFNDSVSGNYKKTDIEAAYVTQLRVNPLEGIGENQGASQQLSDLQPTGRIEDVYEMDVFITQRNANSGLNTFLVKLKTWMDEPKTSANWPQGRFGITVDDDHTKDVTPVRTGIAQIGMILELISYVSDLSGNREKATIRLKVSKGDGT